jgi:hypothetical protein
MVLRLRTRQAQTTSGRSRPSSPKAIAQAAAPLMWLNAVGLCRFLRLLAAAFGLELLGKAGLFQDGIGQVPRLDIRIDWETFS